MPQKDAVALAEKLAVLIKNPDLRKQMGAAGRAKYERQFTLEKFENRLVEIVDEVIKDGCITPVVPNSNVERSVYFK